MHIYTHTHTHMHVYRYVCLGVSNAQLVAETQKVVLLISLTNFNLPYSDVIREVCAEYELTVIII